MMPLVSPRWPTGCRHSIGAGAMQCHQFPQSFAIRRRAGLSLFPPALAARISAARHPDADWVVSWLRLAVPCPPGPRSDGRPPRSGPIHCVTSLASVTGCWRYPSGCCAGLQKAPFPSGRPRVCSVSWLIAWWSLVDQHVDFSLKVLHAHFWHQCGKRERENAKTLIYA